MASIAITGASSGIGAKTAIELTRQGHRVLATGRSAAKLAQVHREMVAVARPGTNVLSPVVADLAELKQVRRLAERIVDALPDLSALINNAAVQPHRRRLSADGHELTLAVNHLAPFLLTNLLVDTLRSSGGRVVTTSSSSHTKGDIDFSDLQMTRRWNASAAYGRSKLANILFTGELRRRTGLPASSAHPGAVRTDINRESPFVHLVKPFEGLILAKPEKGAQVLVWLATHPVGAAPDALYYVHRRAVEPTASALDERVAARLWDVSCDLVGLDD